LVLYLFGAVCIAANWARAGRVLYVFLVRGKARHESLIPLVGFVLVLVGTLLAWNHGWLWWLGVALLTLDLPFTLYVVIALTIVWLRGDFRQQ
jgi:hypothetical protein